VNPMKFLKICFISSCTVSKYVNILWPFVPAAFALVRTLCLDLEVIS
jgi:Ca2+:H+ antiporter